MKKLLIIFLIFTSHIFSMNKEEVAKKIQAAQELQAVFEQYKKQEPELQKEYDKAVTQHQKTPSPVTKRHVKEAQENIASPISKIKKLLRPPLSNHFDIAKMDSDTFKRIAPHIVNAPKT